MSTRWSHRGIYYTLRYVPNTVNDIYEKLESLYSACTVHTKVFHILSQVSIDYLEIYTQCRDAGPV